MAETPLIQRQRALLTRLASLVAERAGAEKGLDERWQKTTTRADRKYEDEAAAAEAEHKKLAAAEEFEGQRRESEAQTRGEAALTAARLRMEKHLRNYNGATTTLGKAAQKEFEESKWLAETLVESGELKIRADFEVARKSIERKQDELKRARAWADEFLADHRHGPLALADVPSVESDPPGTLAEQVKQFDEARVAADAKARALQKAVAPPLLSWGVIFGVAVVAAGLTGFGVYRWGQSVAAETIGLWAGIGGAAAFVLLVAVKLVLRRHVPARSAALAETLVEAMTIGERCLKKVQADRDRQGVELLARRDEELKKAERRLTGFEREVARRNHVGAARLRDRHARRMADIRDRRHVELTAIRSERKAAQAALESQRQAKVAAAAASRDAAKRALKELDQSERGIVERHWRQSVEEIQAEAEAIRGSVAELCPPWDSPVWDGPRVREEVPAAVSFGHVLADMAALPGGLPTDPRMQVRGPTSFVQPAMIDLLEHGSLLIQTGRDTESGPRAIEILKNTMLRLLTAFPPGKVRFTIIDPVGLGQNFAGFMHLADHDEQLVGLKIWTEPKHIEQRLTDLTEHMETVIQKYLRNEYESIQQYNKQAGEVAEPYRFLVISDFPANMTEAAAKRLASIAQSGARCGLYTLIATGPLDGKAKPPAWVPMAALEQSSAVLVWRDGRYVWKDEVLSQWPFTPEKPPADDRLNAILHQVGAAAKHASRVQVPFEFITPKPDQVWTLDSSQDVRVPLGRAGAKALQYMTLGRGTAQHALIAGRTGSGKSTLLHVLVTNLAMWYSPDQIEMYLVDFKKGVEFKTYASHELPHARVVAVESEREFGLSVLRKLDAELTRRGQLFRELEVQDVAGYRKAAGPAASMPRVLLIVDEFQEFFVEDDKLAQESSLLLDRLVRQGRAFGMHVVLGSQTLGGAYSIARSTIGQMAVRVALQCSEADSYLIMSEDNAAPRLLSRPGEAIYNDMSGRPEGNSLFQIVWLPEEKRDAALQGAYDRVRASGGQVPPPPIVFEGNIPANLSSNQALAALLDGRAEPGAVPLAWLGDAISIKDPTAVAFRRQSGSNALIVGQQEDPAAAMLVSTCLSLAAQRAGRIVILDATPADSPHAGTLERVAAGLPGLCGFYRGREVDAAVGEVFDQVQQREQSQRHDAAPMYLVVSGVQRVRELRKEDDFSFSASGDGPRSPAQKLAHILREGPTVGVHTVLWCDTATNVERTLDRNALREFSTRVLFQMSASDSTHLIDTPVASTLGRNRALLHSEEAGTIEKFRPYAPPGAEWLDRALRSVRR